MEKHIFISYSTKNSNIAENLCEYLEERGQACFIAPRNIRSGHEYAEEIILGIDNCRMVLLVLTNDSNNSPHVLREVERAVSKNIPIIVYRVEDVRLTKSMEYFLMTHQWLIAGHGDFEKIYEAVSNFDASQAVSMGGKNTEKRAKSKSVILFAGIGIVVLATVISIIFVGGVLGSKDKSEKNDKDKYYNTSKNDDTNDKSNSNDSSNNNSENNKENDGSQTGGVQEDGKYEVGDTIILGKYLGADIEWKILDISKGGKATIVSDKILTFKAFDTAESGKRDTDKNGTFYDYGELRKLEEESIKVECRGNNDWEQSTLRAWLNSDKDVVSYIGGAPTSAASCDGNNGYNTEKGFLCGFTKEERDIIVETEHSYEQSDFMGGKEVVCSDKIYLPSADDLKLFEEAGVSLYAQPTDEAMEQTSGSLYAEYSEIYNLKEWFWWGIGNPTSLGGDLLDSKGIFSESTDGILFTTGYNENDKPFAAASVYVAEYGVRPVMTIDLMKIKQ